MRPRPPEAAARRRMKMRASAHNRSREMFRAIMIGVASAAVRRFNKKNNTLAELSNVRGLGGRAERLGHCILTEFTWSGVSGCRAWMDGAERMDAKLAEDAADDCEAGDGGTREPPARRRIEPSGLRFLLSFVAGRPFAELFPRPYRLRLPSADEHDCHKTALDTNA